MKKLILNPENPNGILVDMSAEEIAQRETDIADAETKRQEEETAKTNLQNLKTSAKQKLMNGEALTEDEANVMVGL